MGRAVEDGGGQAARRWTPVPPEDFRCLFEQAPGLFLVLDPQLVIVTASNAYLEATMTVRERIVGHHVFEVFPDNPHDPAATGVHNLRASLHRVLATGASDTMAVQKYDVRRPPAAGEGFEERYWSPQNAPVLAADGSLRYIVHRVEDVTDFIRLQQRGAHLSSLTEELRLRSVAMHAEVVRRAQDLQRVNAALRTASDAKNQFLSRVSHELRTPLNAVIGFGDLLSRTPLAQEQAEWVDYIVTAGRHLLRLIDDVLDISSAEGGGLPIAVEPVALGALLAEMLSLITPMAAEHGVRVAPAPEVAADVCVAADPRRLRQVLLNLLSNAVKFNRPRGQVTVTVRRAGGGRVRIDVTDTGHGIAAERRDRLFLPFERLDAAARGVEGTGLGLCLSRDLATAMHGSLDVASTPGAGSTFTLELPAVG